ncbi:hypothetical protein BTA51_12435 [Hahella sp. CCB-MM4]|uniref:SCO family protein n=1 Tax=Hahella sp. (strain CCB-MM4) TaxID=1926491 RepID=UPI000B9A641B|nr:hypothetical protein [Hahella sp. CCB-MM4]OZG73277.1 hypothetical protein BTA51_12435 [Hahella sp. CCB-MM4]
MNEMLEEQPAPRSRGRLKLWVLIVIAAAPLVIAAIMYFGHIGVPSGTTNHGTLMLPPLQAEDWKLRDIQQTDPGFIQYDGKSKWVMLVVGSGECSTRCEEALYLTRQVNVALGKEIDRVTRLLLVPENVPGLEQALTGHESLVRLKFARDEYEGLQQALKEYDIGLQGYDILLMDPLGNIMMHYSSTHTGKDILEDLKRLLKVSKIG